MRAIWSFIKFVIFVAILLLVLCIIFRNWVVKTGIEKGSEFAGVPTTVQSVSISIEDPKIEISGVCVGNPTGKGFKEENSVYEVRKFFCDYDILAMFKKNVHIRDVQVDLSYLNVELSKEGKLNILSLKPDMIKDLKASQGDQQAKEELKDEPQISVDKLMLKLDTVEFQSSVPALPTFKLDINYSNVFENIQGTSAEIAFKVLSQALKGTAVSVVMEAGEIDMTKDTSALINQMANAASEAAGKAAGSAVDKAAEAVGDAVKKAGDAVKGLFKK